MPRAPRAAENLVPLSPPSQTVSGACGGRREAATGVLHTYFATGLVRRAFGLSCNVGNDELNAALAAAVGRKGFGSRAGLDVALLRQALRRPDDSDDAILIFLADVATVATAAENRAALSDHCAEADRHQQAAAECRRRAGVPVLRLSP